MDPLQFKIAIIGIIASGCTGGLAGAFINHWFTTRRDRGGRRLAFRNQIAVLIADLGDIPDSSHKEIHAFYDQSRRDVLVESAKIEADISKCRRGKLTAARADYRDLDKHQKGQLLEIMSHQRQHGLDAPIPPEIDTRGLKAKMTSLLQALHDHAA